jgi:hypothetical protein
MEVHVIIAHRSYRLIVIASLLGLSGSLAACLGADEISADDMDQGADALTSVTLTNPGFESGKTGWGDTEAFAISNVTHSGGKSGKVSESGGKVEQTVTVAANTTYTLSAWQEGKGTLGVKSGSTTLGSTSTNNASFTQVSVTFNSGSATSVTLFGAYNGGEGRFDDFTLTTSGTSSSSAGTTSGAGGSTSAGTTSGSGGSSAVYPSDVLDLANWHLTLPVDTSHAGSPDEIDQPELDGYSNASFFFLNTLKTGVTFRAYTNGVTTSGSGYPRSELRERTNGGATLASWSSSSGKHTLFIDQAVTHLPDVKPHIVVGQIHDSSDDVIVFRLEGQKLFIDLNGNDGPTLTSSYVPGTRFTVGFEVENNAVKCYYNGALKYTYAKSFSGAYFKAGAYVQSSCQGSKKVAGESCSAYGEAVIYDVEVQHQ